MTESPQPHDHGESHDRMETCYIHVATRTIADLVEIDTDSFPGLRRGWYMITRINVPLRDRGCGHGRDILKRITDDADAKGITLALQPLESGGLSQEQLEEWYWRNGFDWAGSYMVRYPATLPRIRD